MPDNITQTLGFDVSQSLQALQQLDAGFAKFDTTLRNNVETLRQFNSTGAQVASSVKNVGSSIKSSMGGAAQATERLAVSFEFLSRIVTTQLTVRFLSQLRNAFESAAESAIQFETRLAEIQTISPGSTIEGLAQEVRALSDAFNIPLLEAAASKYQALSNGFSTAAEQSDVLSAAFKFAKVSQTDAEKSLDLISGVLNAFQKDSSEAEAVAAKLFKTIEVGAIRGSELATALGRVAPVASQLGVRFEEVLAQFAALTQAGVKPAESATQLNAAMSALIKPSEAAKDALKQLGFSSAESLIQAKGLQGGLQALIATTDGSSAAIGRLFPNVRALKDALAINQRGDVFKDFERQISGITTGDFNDILAKRLDIDSERVTSDLNKIKNALTDLGGQFVSAAASVSRFTGGAENLIAVVRPFEPLLLTGAAALSVYAAAALRGATANAAFVASFKGASAGLLLGAGAAAGGNFIGNQLDAAIDGPRKAFDSAADAAIDSFRRSSAERVAAEQEADSKLLQGVEQTIAELNKVYLQDVANAQAAGKQLVQNAEKTADAIIAARQKFGQALDSSLSQSRNQSQGSENRVENLRQDQSDRSFDQSISRLNDVQQAFALINRSSQTAREAAAALEKAAATGNEKEIQQALGLFNRANQTGEQAQQIAERTGNRALESRAVQNLTSNTNRQIEAEQKLQALGRDREAQIQALQEKQQSALDVLREQQSIIAKNSNPFGADGNLLNPEQLAKQAEAVQAALAKIANSRLSGSDLAQADRAGVGQQARDFNLKLSQGVTKLNFDATAGIEQVKGQLQQAMANFRLKIGIDVDALSAAVGKALNNPTEVAAALKTLQDKIGELKQGANDATANDATVAKLKTDLAGISAALDSTGRKLLRFAGPGLLFKSQTDQLDALKTELNALANDPALNDQKIADFFQKIAEFKKSALQGNVAKNVGLAVDVRTLAEAAELLKKLQEAQKQKPADNSADLQKFDSILKNIQATNPAGQFSSSAQSISSAVQPAESVAAAWERAAAAAAATASSAASSAAAGPAAGAFKTPALGGFQTFATGGLAKGTDNIPALLSNREMVINSRQAERFHPQLVAMNAGITPSFPAAGSTTTNGINGDVTVNVSGGGAKVNVKQIGDELNRLIRRGATSLRS